MELIEPHPFHNLSHIFLLVISEYLSLTIGCLINKRR